jgi:predicted DNA-binding protein
VAIRIPNEIKEKWNNLKKRGNKSIHEPKARARENRGRTKT